MLYTWKHKVGGVYDDPDPKNNFHKETRRFLQAVSEHLSEYPLLDLHSNKGGIAVMVKILRLNQTISPKGLVLSL